MNYLKSFVSGSEESAASGAEIVSRLCSRVASSTLLEDRRNAVRALKSLARKYRSEVGDQGLSHLAEVLKTDTGDDEILSYALDCLFNLTVVEDDDEAENPVIQTEIASSLVAAFIESADNVNAVIDLIERSDFSVRWGAIRLLTSLLRTRPLEVQQIVMVKPMGVAHIMDLLTDTREVIRNDAILALIEVTRSNSNIQKIVAFENGFDMVFRIINDEALSDGGVVVEDCILLLLQLLKSNISNQQFFKEGSFIKYLTPFFEIEAESVWSSQKKANILLMLKVVRTLVAPSNPSNPTLLCQLAMQKCLLLQKLSDLLMATGVPTDILTETINTVSEIIRGCEENQRYFSTIMAPWDPPRPALVVLLMSMVNNQQPFALRCAVLYCFQCFLHRNIDGQCSVVNTLLPSSLEPQDISAGQLLCGGLFALSDPLSNWLAATALCHALKNNETAKCQLLRVQLATAQGSPPVTLLKQITSIVLQSPLLQARVGLLAFLCGWLHECTPAVQCLLADAAAVPFLLSQIAENRSENELILRGVCALLLGICILNNDNKTVPQYTKESLIELIIARVGIERFSDTLISVTQHELYGKTMQKPQPSATDPDSLLLDHSFVKLFKQLEDPVIKIISNLEELRKEEEQKAAIEAHDAIVDQYKTLIRDQDLRIGELSKRCSELETNLTDSNQQLASRDQQVQQLRDQYNVLKLTQQAGDNNTAVVVPEEQTETDISDLVNKGLEERDAIIKDLREKLTLQEGGDDALVAEKAAMRNEIAQLKEKLLVSEQANQTLEVELKKERDERAATDAVLPPNNVDTEDLKAQLENQQKEQEDLLLLLSDQEAKIKKLKGELRKLGQEVSEDEDDDDDDEEEEVSEEEENDKN